MDLKISSDFALGIRQIFSVEKHLSLEAKSLLILILASERQTLTCPQRLLLRRLSSGMPALRQAILELEQLGLIVTTLNRNQFGSKSASTYRLSIERAESRLLEAKG